MAVLRVWAALSFKQAFHCLAQHTLTLIHLTNTKCLVLQSAAVLGVGISRNWVLSVPQKDSIRGGGPGGLMRRCQAAAAA